MADKKVGSCVGITLFPVTFEAGELVARLELQAAPGDKAWGGAIGGTVGGDGTLG
jgi:hypothetical protein